MGLDMYAYTVSTEDALTPFKIKEGSDREEIHYWRKHHDLHGWMEKLWREKSNFSKDSPTKEFNCQPVALSLNDLEQLEKDLHQRKLPETAGFFFGNNPPDEASFNDDMEFIQKAREAISKGKLVYYDSWW
jgi:hypothetical protein